MKKVLSILAVTGIIIPCLLICNESETILPNIIGLIYLIVVVALSNTRRGKVWWERTYRTINQ
jgi:hypothetical protein